MKSLPLSFSGTEIANAKGFFLVSNLEDEVDAAIF